MTRLLPFLLLMILVGCTEETIRPTIEFPPQIDTIFAASCATVGCHLPDEHDLAKLNSPNHLAAELDLSSWTGLFEGADGDAIAIPYSSKFSHVLDHIRGVASPRMPPNYPPYNRDTLLLSEEQTLKTWIDNGAPGINGQIAFERVTNRIFTTNQVDDAVSVIAENPKLLMRVFSVGDRPENESPHGLRVTRDGRYFFVSMIATGEVFKYDALSGDFIAKASLGSPVALIELSKDDSKLYVTTNFQVNNTGQNGSITVINTSTMSVIKPIPVGISPHGLTASRDGKLIYASAVYSDRIYAISTALDSVVGFFDVAADVGPSPEYEPYHIGVGPANKNGVENFIYVTCRKRGEVRIFRRVSSSLQLVDSVQVGVGSDPKPTQLDVTPDGKFIYVANSNDSSVSVIKFENNDFSLLTHIASQTDPSTFERHRLSQPNGVTVSRDGRYVYVVNRNKDAAVPPHHGGTGGPGLLTVIEVASNKIIKTVELPPDAYSVQVSQVK
ncbi:MAG: beta-propeller fold lactonase family protein [Bacteroidetes bacterium]|nr:beta-propeller fold lactonase family protein [Bacteroidota bacterium]